MILRFHTQVMMPFHHISNQFVLLLHSAVEKQNAMHYAVRRNPHCSTAVLCLNITRKIEVMNQSILDKFFEVSIDIVANSHEKYFFKHFFGKQYCSLGLNIPFFPLVDSKCCMFYAGTLTLSSEEPCMPGG